MSRELELILLQEETFWKKKSNDCWIMLGNKNTSSFHRQVVLHKSRAKVLALKDANGCWITEQSLLKGMAVNFFKAHYTNDCSPRRMVSQVSFLVLDIGLLNNLS